MKTENENKYFDRKSGQIRVTDLAPHISAFANADGGTIVIGVSDKKRILEGVNSSGDEKINVIINAPKDCCRSMLRYREGFINITNMNCRIRFIRVDGREMQVGANYNVAKNKSIDEPILRLVDVAKAFMADQLLVFTCQEHGSGRFVEKPEYPEFP